MFLPNSFIYEAFCEEENKPNRNVNIFSLYDKNILFFFLDSKKFLPLSNHQLTRCSVIVYSFNNIFRLFWYLFSKITFNIVPIRRQISCSEHMNTVEQNEVDTIRVQFIVKEFIRV